MNDSIFEFTKKKKFRSETNNHEIFWNA